MRLILAIVVALMGTGTTGEDSAFWFTECMKGPGRVASRQCDIYDMGHSPGENDTDNQLADGDVDLLDWADWIIEHPDGVPIQTDP